MIPVILPLSDCQDPVLVGGKAYGLSLLLSAGFSVPDGFCVTTEAYRRHLQENGIDAARLWRTAIGSADAAQSAAALAGCRSLILRSDLSSLAAQCLAQMAQLRTPAHGRWAVRSSATGEDAEESSYAGLYRTRLGVLPGELEQAIKELWASLWDERILQYLRDRDRTNGVPSMAIVLQAMLDAMASGVAYSMHPVTGRTTEVMINAVPGLAAPLVDGRASPDQYVVRMDQDGKPAAIKNRLIVDKSERLILCADGLRREPLLESARVGSSIADDQVLSLARTTKQVEQLFQRPVDLEWAMDAQRLWLLQARPVTAVAAQPELTNDDCEWSRANFKETMPEVPSPLGLSFLRQFMDDYILAHYRRLGCRIPEGLSSVRTLNGRPYLNVTLFHHLVGQLGGDPSLNVEQMGGEPLRVAPPFTKLPWPSLIRAGWLMWREFARVTRAGPRWYAEMKQLPVTYRMDRLEAWSLEELTRHVDELSRWLAPRETTFAIAAGVGQCLQALSSFLPGWIGDEWRALLNGALQGQGTVISAQQILRLAEVAQEARRDERIGRVLLSEGRDLSWLKRHASGTAFLSAFERYLEEYGHRGVGESDIMSPRYADDPGTLLEVVRIQLRGPATSPQAILERQRAVRQAALATIRARCGRRWLRWAVFSWWYRRLCRFFSLREANRHHLMYYASAVRQLLLALGRRLVERGALDAPDDVFFLTVAEQTSLTEKSGQDWKPLIRSRRADRQRWSAMQVPDTIRNESDMTEQPDDAYARAELRGIPVSAGEATGPVRLVRTTADWNRVKAGDIIVVPVIDPGLAPLFGIAAGLVAEMGGVLSHGSIIAREYGIPAVVNVRDAMRRLREGDLVRIDARAGTVEDTVLREAECPRKKQ